MLTVCKPYKAYNTNINSHIGNVNFASIQYLRLFVIIEGDIVKDSYLFFLKLNVVCFRSLEHKQQTKTWIVGSIKMSWGCLRHDSVVATQEDMFSWD